MIIKFNAFINVCLQSIMASSFAWNWGAKDYIYKVPEITIEIWLKSPLSNLMN